MKNDFRVLSEQSLENIDLSKLASEASQENFEKNVFLTTKYEQIVKASVTIMADFSPEFDPPVRWRSKHKT